MATIIKYIFIYISYLWSFIYNNKSKKRLAYLYSLCFYGWIKRKFNFLGKVFFEMPTYLGNVQYMDIKDGTYIGRRVMIQATDRYMQKKFSPKIVIGEKCTIGDDSNIQCCNSIKLGNNVLLGRKVMINDTSHGRFMREQLDIHPNLRPLYSKGNIEIDDNVWIGELVCILGNVHIGTGSIIGAGSVVTKDVPPYSLAVGCPAKVIKQFNN